MFYGCTNLTDVAPITISSTANGWLTNMFYGCSKLKYIDVTNFNTSNVTKMNAIFYNCTSLVNVDLSSFTGTNSTTFQQMFVGCSNLEEVNLSNLKSNYSGYTCAQMFQGCTKLEKIDIRSMDFSNISQYGYSNMFGTTASNYVPDDCLIIVKDDTQKTWITTNFSRLTNVKTVAELQE